MSDMNIRNVPKEFLLGCRKAALEAGIPMREWCLKVMSDALNKEGKSGDSGEGVEVRDLRSRVDVRGEDGSTEQVREVQEENVARPRVASRRKSQASKRGNGRGIVLPKDSGTNRPTDPGVLDSNKHGGEGGNSSDDDGNQVEEITDADFPDAEEFQDSTLDYGDSQLSEREVKRRRG
jgi:hypothetical protein